MFYKHDNGFVRLNTKFINGWISKLNPLKLPDNTVRVRTNNGNVPYKESGYTSYETVTLVSGTSNVYDVYKSGTDFSSLLEGSNNVIEVLGANTSKVTKMLYMFNECKALETVALFDTSNVTDMGAMFSYCEHLTAVPLLDTSRATNMNYMFAYCNYVRSGALALYQQASSQAKPPHNHSYTFFQCGSKTTSGLRELAQIPSDWKSYS